MLPLQCIAVVKEVAVRYGAAETRVREVQAGEERPLRGSGTFGLGKMDFAMAHRFLFKGLKERPLKGPLGLYRDFMRIYMGYIRVILGY